MKISAYLMELHRAYFPEDGITREEKNKTEKYIKGGFLLQSNIRRLIVFLPFLYPTLLFYNYPFFLIGNLFNNSAMHVTLFLLFITAVWNIFCVHQWLTHWKFVTSHLTITKICYLSYWWILATGLNIIAFIVLDNFKSTNLFIISCLIIFIIPLTNTSGIIRRLIAIAVIYCLICIDIDNNSLFKTTERFTTKIALFHLTISISAACTFFQKNQYHYFKVYSYIYHQANTDILTNCYNRKGGQLHLNRVISQNSLSCGILILDVDNFKMYNDTFGHDSGDKCLKKIGNTLRKIAIQNNSIAIRHGGEEFVIIPMQDMDSEQLIQLGEKIRTSVINCKIKSPQTISEDYVTVSIGITTADIKKGDNYESLIPNADVALYSSKRNGRNQVTLFT